MHWKEKRRASRLPVRLEIHYATPVDVFTKFTENLNEGGIFIETEKPSPLGTAVDIEFYLPGDHEPIKTRGMVVWSAQNPSHSTAADVPCKPGMGIEFEQLDGKSLERINTFVKRVKS